MASKKIDKMSTKELNEAILKAGGNPVGKSKDELAKEYIEILKTVKDKEIEKTVQEEDIKKVEATIPASKAGQMVMIKVSRNHRCNLSGQPLQLITGKWNPVTRYVYQELDRRTKGLIKSMREVSRK